MGIILLFVIAIILDYLFPMETECIKADPVTLTVITAASLAASLGTAAYGALKKPKKPKLPPQQKLLDPETRRPTAALLNPTGGQGVTGSPTTGKKTLGE